MINLLDHYVNGEKLYEQVVSTVYKKYNLTYMEFTILMFLYNNKKYDTATEIISYRHLSKSHVSSSIKSLESKGYLTSFYLESNHRTIHLKLLDSASSICKEGKTAQNRFKDIITEGLTKEEVDMLLSFLNRIDKNVNDNL